MQNEKYYSYWKQSGAALMLSLVILSLLTLIAVTGMRGAVVEEKMAGNLRDRDLAFQAAESAIRAAENMIDGFVAIAALDGTNGLLGQNDAEPDYYDSAIWDTSSTVTHVAPSLGTNLSAPPRFTIKHVGNQDISNPDPTFNPLNQVQFPNLVNVFLITAKGAGVSDDAEVILQSYYARKNL